MFKLNEALESGYTTTEVAGYLSRKHGFKYDDARSSGYSDDQILDYLMQKEQSLYPPARADVPPSTTPRAAAAEGITQDRPEPQAPTVSTGASPSPQQAGSQGDPFAASVNMLAEAAGGSRNFTDKFLAGQLRKSEISGDSRAGFEALSNLARSSDQEIEAAAMETIKNAQTGYMETAGRGVLSGAVSIGQGLAGIERAAGETLQKIPGLGGYGKILEKVGSKAGEIGKNVQEKLIPPDLGDSETKRYLYEITANLSANLPALALGPFVGGMVVLGSMAATAAGNKYEELRENGVEQQKAALGALGQGIIEYATESISIGALLKKVPFGKKALEFTVKEIGGEELATLLEMALDKVAQNKNATWGEVLQAMTDTAVVAGFSAQAQNLAIRGIQKLQDKSTQVENVLKVAESATEATDALLNGILEDPELAQTPEFQSQVADLVGMFEEHPALYEAIDQDKIKQLQESIAQASTQVEKGGVDVESTQALGEVAGAAVQEDTEGTQTPTPDLAAGEAVELGQESQGEKEAESPRESYSAWEREGINRGELQPVEQVVPEKFIVREEKLDPLMQIPGPDITKPIVTKDQVADNEYAVVVDIDKFKAVNSAFGYRKADNALREIGRQFKAYFADGFYGRFGGEELVAKVKGQDLERIQAFVEEVSTSISIDGQPVTVSAGIGKSFDEADKNLHQAKTSGRNQLAYLDENGNVRYIKGKQTDEKRYVHEHRAEELEEISRDSSLSSDLRDAARRESEGIRTRLRSKKQRVPVATQGRNQKAVSEKSRVTSPDQSKSASSTTQDSSKQLLNKTVERIRENTPDKDLPIGLQIKVVDSKGKDAALPQGRVKSVNPDIEKRLESAKQTNLEKIGVFAKMIQDLKEDLRQFPYLDSDKDGVVIEILRRFKNIRESANAGAIFHMQSVIAGLNGDQYHNLSRYIVLRDILEDIQRGTYDDREAEWREDIKKADKQKAREMKREGYQIQFGYELTSAKKDLEKGTKKSDLVRDLEESKAAVEGDEQLEQALEHRDNIIKQYTDQLVELGLLKDDAGERKFYFHHRVLEYIEAKEADFVGTGAAQVRQKKRGERKSRVGSSLDYSTNLLGAEMEVLAHTNADIKTFHILKEMKAAEDIQPQLVTMARDKNLQLFTGLFQNKPEMKKMLALEEGQAREDYITEKLGEKALTWEKLIPSDYTNWMPERGNNFFRGLTVSEKAMTDYLEQGEELLPEDFRSALVLAKKKAGWVIPKNVAKTMDQFRPPEHPAALARFLQSTIRAWKIWQLQNPLRALKYNLNNFSGDLDAVLTYDPAILKFKNQASGALYDYYWNKKPDAFIMKMIDLGVIGSQISIQEIPDVAKMDIFKAVRDNQNLSFLGKGKEATWDRWFETIGSLSAFREATMRVAAYNYFLEKVGAYYDAEAGKYKEGYNIYGSSKKEEIDTLIEKGLDPEKLAAKLSRELLGDYGAISKGGQYLRQTLIPFYSWMEVNPKRYYNLFRNLPYEGRMTESEARSAVGKLAAKSAATHIAVEGTFLTARAMILYGIVALWNKWRYPEEDEQLRRLGERHYLICGYREDGSIRTIRFEAALSDALSYFGLQRAPGEFTNIIMGNKSVKQAGADIWTDMGLGRAYKALREDGPVEAALNLPIVNKVVLASSPIFRPIVEGWIIRKSLYPRADRPSPIRDPYEHYLRSWSLDRLYRMAKGKPARSGDHWKELVHNTAFYSIDVGESSYYAARQLANDFMSDMRGEKSGTGGSFNDKSNALYYMMQAFKYGDNKAFEKYRKEYKALGGTDKDMARYIKRANPLELISGSNDLEKAALRRKFLSGLTKDERAIWDDGISWYQRTYKSTTGERSK